MAVMRNSIIFGGVDSADFGIYIGGEGTFNAPKRDVEMISIPGRNGAFALDKGRFENIEVTYSAFNYEKDLATFARQLSDFRNAICSQKGYQRLTDTFHLEEYRMAAYVDGLEIKPIDFNTASTFDITFDCKPQRYLTSGEEAIDVDSGDTITNPTLFESSPMLEVEGYGTIAFNGYEIELTNDVIGDVLLLGATNDKTYIYYDGSLVNTNDVVTIHDHRNLRFRTNVTTASYTPTSATLTRTTSNIPGTFSYTATLDGRNFVIDLFYSGNDTFSYGTTSSKRDTFTLNIGYTDGNTSGTLTRTFNVTQRATSRYVQTYSTENTSGGIQIYGSRCSYGEITAYSTQTILGHPTYVECDIGVCYKEVDGEAVSLNQYIDLGSDLPKLASGANTITADNTVTDLKVIPRWWRV